MSKNIFKKPYFILLAFCLFLVDSLSAQNIEMANAMRDDGKIYVVISVVLIIFIGLIVYLFSIDRKVKKLEQEIKK